MRIGIVGLGAIGSLWAVKLHTAGHQVIAITRPTPPSSLSLQLDEASPITLVTNQYTSLARCHCILVCVKSTQVVEALTPLLPFLSPTIPLILLHNGMGVVDNLSPHWHDFPLLLATTTHAALKTSPNTIKHTGLGQTHIGMAGSHPAIKATFRPHIAQLSQALPEVMWLDNIHSALWKKLAINCVINPLTAIHNIPNGQLHQPHYHTMIQALIQECHQVMQAEQQNLSITELTEWINQVITHTAQNYSSMHQDIHHHRRTEIDFITGFLLNKAKQHGIDTPTHQNLFHIIKQKERHF